MGRHLLRLIDGRGGHDRRRRGQQGLGSFEVRVAKDGPEALAVLARGPPYDFVVLDLTHDDVLSSTTSGWALLRAIHATRARPRVLVVSLTDDDGAVVRAFREGADLYVPAPLLAAPGGLAALMVDRLVAYARHGPRRR